MRTKREQVQAHRFVIRRIVSGLVQGNPEALEFPMRRTAGSMIGGLAIALLVFAGFWVVGAIFGSADWRKQHEGAIVVDEESGATFVYLGEALYPVENITSAQLFVEDADAKVFQATSADLLDVPRGDGFGIEDAPDQVPPAGELVDLPWQVCSAPKRGNDKEQVSHITLSAPKADDRLRREGQLVVADDEYSVLWNDLRFAVPDPALLTAIDFQTNEAVAVDPVFLASIREGPPLKAPEVPGDGDAHKIPGFPDAENGDFLTSADTVYVLTAEGFAKATQFDRMLLNEGVEPEAGEVTSTVLDQVGTGFRLHDHDLWPESLDELGDPPLSESGVICAVYDSSDSHDVAIATYPPGRAPKAITHASPTTKQSDADEVSTAEHVWTPGGKGALVREQGSESATGGTVYLITGNHRYGLSEDAVESLGYAGIEPTPVPWSLVALVPEGPELSHDAAIADFTPFPKAE